MICQGYMKLRGLLTMAECSFYHTMDIPAYGHAECQWDLRQAA